MPQCELVEVRKAGPIQVPGWAGSPADAQRAADKRAGEFLQKEFLSWLEQPCPASCPVKLIYGLDYMLGRPRQPVYRDPWWIGFADFRYSAAVVCLSGSARDTI